MAVPALALLDGRYQLIRQLGGPPRTPLMVASDLQTGRVVCVRLQRFTTAMANLAAVPLLAPDAPPTGDEPLLPRDFGVDEGTAYLVRDYVTAASLQQLLDAPAPLSVLEVVTILRRAGDALLVAVEQGFRHPGLALRHLLVTAEGAVRVCGYDAMQHDRARAGAREGAVLASLVLEALDGAEGATPIGTGRAATAAARSGARTAALRLPTAPRVRHGPVQALLLRCRIWQATPAPDLADVVRNLRQCEQQLLGYSRVGAAWQRGSRAVAALFRRLRHLGPLLHPYLIVLALTTIIIVSAVRTLTSPAYPGRLLVYPIPTRASNDIASNDFFASPPQVLVTADTGTTPATTAPRAAGAAAPNSPSEAPARLAADRAPVERHVVPPPPDARRPATAAPSRQSINHTRVATGVTTRATASRATLLRTTSTVIVTSLTAQRTIARVTVIAATSERSSVLATATARLATTTLTRVTTASALHAPPTTSKVTTTSTVGGATASSTRSSATTTVARLR